MIKSILIFIKKVLTRTYLRIKYKKKDVKIDSYLLNANIKLGLMCHIGKKVYIGENCEIGDFSYFNSRFNYSIIESNTLIGKYCSIGDGVTIGLGNHNYKYISTHPFLYDSKFYKKILKTKNSNLKKENLDDKNIITKIGNDVWIGANSNIKRGITIGDGAVIGMNAVVTKNVPPYAIVVGTPAKIIGYRFSEKEIENLLSIKWWDWPYHKTFKNIEMFYDIEKFCNNIKNK